MDKKDKIIKKCVDRFGDKFTYINFDNNIIEYTCNTHNRIIKQNINTHLKGNGGCRECSKKPIVDTEYFINKSKLIHGDKYDYSKTKYVDSKTKVTIICSKHGEFKILPNHHYKQECPLCSKSVKNMNKILGNDKFINKAILVHGDKYDYSNVDYIDSKTKVKIICKEHGEFEQQPYSHLRGKGCIKCSIDKKKKMFTSNTEDFITKSKIIHGDKYDYHKTEYIKAKDNVIINCKEHGEFEQIANDHLSGHGCQKCGEKYNIIENEVKEFLNSLNISFISNDRKLLNGKEIDIFIPLHGIGIEYNGLYWHTEEFIKNSFHLEKTELAKSNGIQLIHIFEDEWLTKKNIVKSRLKNILKLTENRIFGRKCVIKEISHNEKKDFLIKNHIQGDVNSKHNIGLYYNDELISIMTFGLLRKNLGQKSEIGQYELLRFCNKLNYSVIGGANKLLQYFIKTYSPNKIISYADRRYSNGNLYDKLNFKFIYNTKPNYFYVINKKRFNRFSFRKDVLVKEGYDKTLSEHQIMLNRGIYRIYDCGSMKFELNV